MISFLMNIPSIALLSWLVLDIDRVKMCNACRVGETVGQLNPYQIAGAKDIYFSVSKGYKFLNKKQKRK
jgi:hypothetical protein